MGRASKWLRGLLGFKKPDPKADPAQRSPSKKRWSFSKGKDRRRSQYAVVSAHEDEETSRHAIAVAAAAAAVAEAAVAAAHAAAAVVQLTSGGDQPAAYGYGGGREEWAAVAIQSHFRAYLSRRALRALRALVRLQALVRGRIQRKQNADKLRQLQAIVRAQVRAKAGRIESHHSSKKPSRFNHSARASPDRVDHRSKKHEHQPTISKRNSTRSCSNISHDLERSPLLHNQWMDEEKTDKILEIDTGKPHTKPKRRNIFSSSQDQSYHSGPPLASCTSPSSVDVDGSSFYTATNSPQYYYSSSVDGSLGRGPFTPAKSDGSRSYLSGSYADHPSYMAYTESAKAKARSVSAPRQRPQWERTSSTNRYSVPDPSYLTLQSSYSLKAYPGSGRLDRLGMPVRDVSGYSGSLCNRY